MSLTQRQRLMPLFTCSMTTRILEMVRLSVYLHRLMACLVAFSWVDGQRPHHPNHAPDSPNRGKFYTLSAL